MSLNNENCPVTVECHLGTVASGKTVPVMSFPKKAVLSSVKLIDGVGIAASNSNYTHLELQDSANAVVASLDTRAANEGAVTANVAKSFSVADTELPAGEDLKLVYTESEGVAEITRITVPAEMVGSDLHEKGFLIHDEVGSVDVWFDIDNAGGTEPTNLNTAGDRAIECLTVSAADDAEEIAAALAAKIHADSKFNAVVDPLDATSILVTSSTVGIKTNASDGLTTEASGLTIAVATQGVDVVAQTLTNAKLAISYFMP